MQDLSPNEKGAIAEACLTAQALRMGIVVLRPVVEGRRYDLVFDFDGQRIERVQCKWGRLVDDVIHVGTGTCRFTPRHGYVRTTYNAEEVDAFGIYCAPIDRCFYVPVGVAAGKSVLHLRLKRARNNQRAGVTLAADYQFGAVAQLGERRHGMAEVRGSIPLSST